MSSQNSALISLTCTITNSRGAIILTRRGLKIKITKLPGEGKDRPYSRIAEQLDEASACWPKNRHDVPCELRAPEDFLK